MIFQGRQALPARRWRAYDAVKAIFRLVCRSEQRSLISLLNAAKKQPAVSPSPRNPRLSAARSAKTAKAMA